ncbi:hypothetical protein LEP1GSC036_1017 [Leptospira weilii str. 2006001853]|uniref:Uncharacterized protein n=3 Tax=Leptospira weilii TaxID=28184 RepID=A0A828YXS7_9LEPT|nr:hypothetical protein [Leptospira weilii]EMM73518.1 hypothetical protein LEP1GSC038_2744 [Leptospira weilii str. 2006001855]EKR62330.1 hypothetical protein LEP1GSC036_1726 [Leptospira weilii str. 2006001853]EKR64654.1 hypothetical protein LEP1GSC036_3400 [Leptospira weilii str. 2006001853]EKR66164.1 hypothetical protein LEP1GSC036_1017 [Leptospira weilii str. 2006001853]MCL8268272.1 hypothetical protein [Leptospira weilii]
MKFNTLLRFLFLLFATVYGVTLFDVGPVEFVKVYFPFGGTALLSLMGASVPDAGLYNEKPGLYGTASRDSNDERKRGSVVSVGRLPFGSAIMLVAGGEGVSVMSADPIQDSKDIGVGNSGIRVTTRSPNIWAAIAIVNPGTNNATLSMAVTGQGTQDNPYRITINAATNGSAAIASIASQIKSALEADTTINGIISVELLGDGSGVMSAIAMTSLTKIVSDLRFDGVTSYSTAAGDLKKLSYEDGQLCTFVEKGYVWVPCEEVTTEFDPVRVRVVSEGDILAGSFRTTAIPGKTAVITGVKFASKQEIGIAELNLASGFYTITLDN